MIHGGKYVWRQHAVQDSFHSFFQETGLSVKAIHFQFIGKHVMLLPLKPDLKSPQLACQVICAFDDSFPGPEGIACGSLSTPAVFEHCLVAANRFFPAPRVWSGVLS